MSRATLRLEGKTLRLEAEAAGIRERRRIDESGIAHFLTWAAQYRRIAGSDKPAERLDELGRTMAQWLDGGERWLARLRATATPPLVLDFEVPAHPDEVEQSFLEAPWELVADEHGPLAGRDDVLFCPVRRIGQPAAPVAASDYRLHVVFMAATPEGVSALRFEEEEAAILRAAGSVGVDLVVEDTGTLPLLAEQIARESPVDVVHLSCHGSSAEGPQLWFEDDVGRAAKVSPAELARELGTHLPALLFLSACLTAEPDHIVGSFARTLTQRGCRAVLGWSGSVRDTEATRFASELYRRLSRKESLEHAVAWARRELLSAPAGSSNFDARDWHLARLYLSPSGGGALTRSERSRHRRAKDAGHKEMLDKKRDRVPVASRDEFVGRRRELRSLLAEVRLPTQAGLLLYGLGRQGKSSLVARLAHRSSEHELAVVFEDYDALAVLEAVEERCARREVTDIVKAHCAAVRNSAGALRDALREILEGPCREVEKTARGDIVRRPILLVVDDLEQVLEAPSGGGLHTVRPAFMGVVCALVDAFDGAETRSRLILTSRYRFTLTHRGRDVAERLLDLHVSPMSEADRRKQALARIGPAVDNARQKRAIALAQGNPGLQELLFRLGADEPSACDAALDAIESYLGQGADPGDGRVSAFLAELAIEQLLSMLSAGEKELLRASRLFDLPVPVVVLEGMVTALGVRREAIDRLLAFGLWDRLPDPVDPKKPAAMLNPLVRPRVGVLTEEESGALAVAIVDPLFDAWGGTSGQRNPVLELELTRLGVAAGHVASVAACAGNAVQLWISAERALLAANMGRAVVALLERKGLPVSVTLLRATAEACERVGATTDSRAMLAAALQAAVNDASLSLDERGLLFVSYGRRLGADGLADAALQAFENAQGFLQAPHCAYERAIILGEISAIRAENGQMDEALRLLDEARAVFEDLGERRSRALIIRDIANIRVVRGEVAEALRLLHETLAVLEELGERRARGLLLGDIARIRIDRGEMDEAWRLQHEALALFTELGDVRERAATIRDIARIQFSQGYSDDALRLHREARAVFEELKAARQCAITDCDIAHICFQQGEVDQALHLLEEALAIFEKMGTPRERAATLGQLARIRFTKGEVDESMRLHNEAKAVFEQVGDRHGRAVVLGEAARIHVRRGEINEALILYNEALGEFEKLGNKRSQAITLCDIAGIHSRKGALEQSLSVYRRSLSIFEALGDQRSRALVLGDIARILTQTGAPDEALRLHQDRLAVLEQQGERGACAKIRGDIARILFSKGSINEALRLHEDRLAVFKDLGDRNECAVTLGDLARIHLQTGAFAEALRLHQDRLAVHEELEDRLGCAQALGDIAIVRLLKGEVDEALRLHEERLAVYEGLGDRRERALTLGCIAGIRFSKGEVHEAFRLRQEALRVFEELGDRRSRAIALAQIAEILGSRGEMDDALRLHREAFSVFEELGERRDRALSSGQIARILVFKGQIDEGLRLFQEKLSVLEELGERRERAVTLVDIARIHASRGDLDKALCLNRESLAIFEELGERREQAVAHGDIAGICESKGDLDEAVLLHYKALAGYEELGDLVGIASSQWSLGKLELTSGRIVEGRELLTQAYALVLKVGRLDGIGLIGLDLAPLLSTMGRVAEAKEILMRSRDAFLRMSQFAAADQAEGLLGVVSLLDSGV